MTPVKILFFLVDLYCIKSVLFIHIYYKFPQILLVVSNGVVVTRVYFESGWSGERTIPIVVIFCFKLVYNVMRKIEHAQMR